MEKETYFTPEITWEEVFPGLTVLCASPSPDTLNALGGLSLFGGSPDLEGPQLEGGYKPPK